jgi:hypothetical protein
LRSGADFHLGINRHDFRCLNGYAFPLEGPEALGLNGEIIKSGYCEKASWLDSNEFQSIYLGLVWRT